MRKWILPVILLVAVQAQALTSITAYKTFTREVLTSDDLNQSFTTVITGINSLIAKFPGDSVKTTYGAFDSLVAKPGPNLVVLDPLVSKSADDSLNYHLANVDRLNADTLNSTGTTTLDTLSVSGPTTLDTVTSTSLAILDTARIDSGRVTNLSVLTKVDVQTAGGLFYDGTAITSTATELNALDGYTGSAANLETLTDDSMADALHRHAELSASDGTPNQVVTISQSGAVAFSNGFTASGDITVTGDLAATDLDGIIGSNTPAAATVTTLTSTGIDDNATGEILQITDAGATVAGDFSATDLDGIIGSNTAAAGTFTDLTVAGQTTVDTITSTSLAILDTARIDSARITKLNVSGASTFTGAITFDDITSTGQAVLDTARADSLTAANLTALTRVVFSGASSVLMPAAITMPSGTDGHILTSDGNGRVILEAAAVYGGDTDSTLANAGGSTVALRVDTGGDVIVVNDLTASALVSFSGASSVLMPTAITMPSGTDGHVLTSDGNGRVILEAAAAAATDDFADSLKTSAFVRLPDSTLTTNAHGELLLVGNLNDPETMWDKDRFRALSEGTAWQNASGHFPERYWIEVDTVGIDSLRIRDMNDMSVWMLFEGGAGYILRDPGEPTDISFLDGILRVSMEVGSALIEIDFTQDVAFLYSTGGQWLFPEGISGRNSGTNLIISTNANLALAGGITYDVAATRDPFGMPMPDGSGRTAQWWAVSTNGSVVFSHYDPYKKGIFDNYGGPSDLLGRRMILGPRGNWLSNYRTGSRNQLQWSAIIGGGADYKNRDLGIIHSARSGSEDLAWDTGAIPQVVDAAWTSSAAGNQSPLFMVGSDDVGLYLLHTKANDNTNGGKVLIDATGHNPYSKGADIGVFHLEDLTDGGSGGNDLTKYGTTDAMAGNVAMVFGTGYSSTSAGTASYLKDVGAAVSYRTTRTIHTWFKSASASNPGAVSYLFAVQDHRTGNEDLFALYFNSTTGTMVGWVADGAAADTPTVSVDLLDAQWHHVAMVLDEGADALWIYVDGELAGSDESLAIDIGQHHPDSLFVGTSPASGSAPSTASSFQGQIDQFAVMSGTLTPAEVRAIYNDGLKAMQATGTTNDALAATDVDYIHANDGYVVVGDEDSLQVFVQGGTTIIEELRVASVGGNIQDAQVWIEPGTDSLSYGYLTTTHARVVQTDPNMLSAAQHRWTWEQPLARQGGWAIVDSSGVEGIFWNGDDAIDAEHNAGQNGGLVQFLKGTYPPFDVDQAHMRVFGTGYDTVIDGGTTDDAIDVLASQVEVAYFHVKTTGGGGNPFDGIDANTGSAVSNIHHNRCTDSDQNCFVASSNGSQSHWHHNYSTGPDDHGHSCDGAQSRFTSNISYAAGAYGMIIGANGDNSIFADNLEEGSSTGAMLIVSGANQNLVHGNRTDGAITDSGTGNSVVDNLTTAF